MAETQSKSPQKKCTSAVGSPSGSKYSNRSIRRLARLLNNKPDAISVSAPLACLLLEPLDRLVSLRADLDLVSRDEVSKDPQQRERVRQLRLALDLEAEYVSLLSQVIAGIRECVGGAQRLMFDLANNNAAMPEAYLKDPGEERVNAIVERLARIVVERHRLFGLKLPDEITGGLELPPPPGLEHKEGEK